MLQGTMSGVGKSLLVAGLCRVLAQDGVRVAPFKSQNMALNSAITVDGLEMGRAQAMQAEAAGIEPTVDMNPVLLKPSSNTGSQVILRGRPIAQMSAREYFAFRHTLVEQIMGSYQALAEDFDVILIEGAGSPVELNLRRDDIVNMGLARLVSSPVLLVGDIDCGGVFAQLIGTMMLLDEDERHMVRASVVNKFRGDASLFDEGLDILRERMGVPVAGLVPFMDLDLDDEDSLSDRLLVRRQQEEVDVAVIRLPKISNFTDFIALDAVPGVGVRYVTRPSELGRPDLLVIPGTKATMSDLAWLRDRGLARAIVVAADEGMPVLGICGGYQMLGTSVSDPLGVEGGGMAAGLGLLPVRTEFVPEKRTMRSEGHFRQVTGPLATLSGVAVSGYEIHAGRTLLEGGEPLLDLKAADGSQQPDGCQCDNVYGCYLHGLCDCSEVTRALVSSLRKARGLSAHPIEVLDMVTYRERQYDLLAAGLREHMDLDLVYRIIEEGL